jgi:hypothetical protein
MNSFLGINPKSGDAMGTLLDGILEGVQLEFGKVKKATHELVEK